MRFYEGNFLILDTKVNFSADNITMASLELIGGRDAVRLRLHPITDLVLVEVMNKPVMEKGQVNIDGWFSSVLDRRDSIEEAVQPLAQMLRSSGHEVDETVARRLLHIPINCDLNRTKSVDKGLLTYAQGSVKTMTMLNRLVLIDDVEYQHANENKLMLKEDDTVLLRLPEADLVTSHQLNTPYAIDKLTSVWAKPFPNRLYEYRDIINILKAPTTATRISLVESLLSDLTSSQGFNLKLPADEIFEIRDRFQALPLEHVVGDPANDNMYIMDNERDFYDNLIAFIKWHIKRFHREVLGDSASEEELDRLTEDDFAKGELPVRLKDYLKSLTRAVARLNFKYTGNFLYKSGSLDDEADDDDDTDSVLESDSGSKGFSDNDSMDKVNWINQRVYKANLDEIIHNYLELSASTHSAAVWAEAVIKLMRWGSRKISNLSVGVNNQIYLDPRTMKIANQQLTNLTDFEIDKDSRGRSLELLGATFLELKGEEDSRIRSYPLVLLGREEGYLPGNDEPIPITYTISLFDIVKQFLAGESIVYDIEFEDGKFVDTFESRSPLVEYSMPDVIKANLNSKILHNLKDFAIENGIAEVGGTASIALEANKLKPFYSVEPLLERLNVDAKTRTQVVKGTVAAILNEGAQDYNETGLVPLLNWYYENIFPTHNELWNNCFGGEVEEASPINARNHAASNLFGTANTTQVSEEIQVEEEQEMKFVYPIYEGEELQFGKIERKKESGEIVGAYAVSPTGGRVYASLDEVTEFSVNVPTMHLGLVLTGMFEVMISADPGNNLTSRHSVISENSITDIYRKHSNQ